MRLVFGFTVWRLSGTAFTAQKSSCPAANAVAKRAWLNYNKKRKIFLLFRATTPSVFRYYK